MMDDGDSILELARSIRPYLHELLPAPAAGDLDAELGSLLAGQAAERSVPDVILERLRQHESTHVWASEFLANGLPPDVADVEKGYSPLPGMGAPISPAKYACPFGDYTWYRRDIGQPVPRCATHDIALVPSTESRPR